MLFRSTLRGGGQDIRRVTATPDGQASNSIELDVTIPLEAPDGAHAFAVEAHAGEVTATLELEVMVSAEQKDLLDQAAARSRSNLDVDPTTGADLGAGPGAGSTKARAGRGNGSSRPRSGM